MNVSAAVDSDESYSIRMLPLIRHKFANPSVSEPNLESPVDGTCRTCRLLSLIPPPHPRVVTLTRTLRLSGAGGEDASERRHGQLDRFINKCLFGIGTQRASFYHARAITAVTQMRVGGNVAKLSRCAQKL